MSIQAAGINVINSLSGQIGQNKIGHIYRSQPSSSEHLFTLFHDDAVEEGLQERLELLGNDYDELDIAKGFDESYLSHVLSASILFRNQDVLELAFRHLGVDVGGLPSVLESRYIDLSPVLFERLESRSDKTLIGRSQHSNEPWQDLAEVYRVYGFNTYHSDCYWEVYEPTLGGIELEVNVTGLIPGHYSGNESTRYSLTTNKLSDAYESMRFSGTERLMAQGIGKNHAFEPRNHIELTVPISSLDLAGFKESVGEESFNKWKEFSESVTASTDSVPCAPVQSL